MFRSNNGSLSLARERFPSASSILEGRKPRKSIEDNGYEKKVLQRTRRATRSAGDRESAITSQKDTPITLRKKKLSISTSAFPNKFKLSNNNNSDNNDDNDIDNPLKRISSVENPFSFSENPALIQLRLQTLGTSDLQVCVMQLSDAFEE